MVKEELCWIGCIICSYEIYRMIVFYRKSKIFSNVMVRGLFFLILGLKVGKVVIEFGLLIVR